MSDLVIASQILAGSGAAGWTAAKLLGPSMDSIGAHIRHYLGNRVSKVFQEVERLAQDKELKQLPPGFIVSATQRISASEDDQLLNRMWAELLISASDNYSSRYMVFADILAQIGPDEARLLKRIGIDKGEVADDHFDSFHDAYWKMMNVLDKYFYDEFTPIMENKFTSEFEALKYTMNVAEKLVKSDKFPGIVIHGVHIYQNPESSVQYTQKEDAVSINVLERQNIVTVKTFSGGGPRINNDRASMDFTMVRLTDLGASMLDACKAQE